MSIAFDAKQQALAAWSDNREAAVDLFLCIIGASEEDFKYEFGQSSETYIFGDEESAETK